VSDSGEGIKPEFLPHVFDRFRQADASASRKHGGLGLGLAIVKHLTELHGGSVTAKSPGAGKGSTFTIALPVAHATREESRQAVERPRPVVDADSPPPNLDGINVLVVDDQPDSRQLVKELLNECGAKVEMAGSASDGLKQLKQFQPQVLVSDIGMPEVDGYEFIRQVRNLAPGEGGKVPAVALTAFARAEDRLLALKAGYQMHVAKPVNPDELKQVVATLASAVR
jgi:CheY-like chemotaxis protein